ncbi:MAG: beta-galactosidase [Spirochaetes bacterium]|nr:beta-galactosidase [Spirochaetota bacterium]
MKTLTWDHSTYYIDRKPAFLVSGEFHYFRVPKADWERRLILFKKAGGNCVATYVPWILHEPKEGDFHFGDIPERDLEGFLSLCASLDMFVIARPGPYQYSELRYDGLPPWLCDNYPELRARNIAGEPFRISSISYLHPLFLEKTKRWFDAVCPRIAKHMRSKDGAVAMVQIDNELMGIHEWFGGWDYNPETMGFGREDGRYPQFLKKRYGTIAPLNAAYNTSFAAFADVRPTTGPKTASDARRVKDYDEFYFTTIAEYSSTLAGWMRGYGIDCTICHNSGNPNMNAYFRETVAALGNKEFILGSDHYYNLNLEWAQNNPTPQYAANMFMSLEMLRSMGFPPSVLELPAGSLSDWPPITGKDLSACYMTNCAFGMKGINYYIFTGGKNPAGTGVTGEIYDYGAPVSANGEVRPSYKALQRFGSFLKRNAWMAGSRRVSDVNIGLQWQLPRGKYSFNRVKEIGYSDSEAWEFTIKGALLSSQYASLSPNFADLSSDELLTTLTTPLIVPSSVSMSADIQKRLVSFVSQGGSILLAPVVPYLDEKLNACTILRDYIGSPVIEPITVQSPIVTVGGVNTVFMNGGLFKCVKRPDHAEPIASEETTKSEIGWSREMQGGGTVIWLGMHWKNATKEHAAMMRYLVRELGGRKPVVWCDNQNLLTSLRVKDNKAMLFVMNLFSAPAQATVTVDIGNGKHKRMRFSLGSMEVKTRKFTLAIKAGK